MTLPDITPFRFHNADKRAFFIAHLIRVHRDGTWYVPGEKFLKAEEREKYLRNHPTSVVMDEFRLLGEPGMLYVYLSEFMYNPPSSRREREQLKVVWDRLKKGPASLSQLYEELASAFPNISKDTEYMDWLLYRGTDHALWGQNDDGQMQIGDCPEGFTAWVDSYLAPDSSLCHPRFQ